MTKEKLDELNSLHTRLENLVALQQGFASQLGVRAGVCPDRDQNRRAVNYIIEGAQLVIRDATWDKIRELIADDIEQARAEAKVAFEFA